MLISESRQSDKLAVIQLESCEWNLMDKHKRDFGQMVSSVGQRVNDMVCSLLIESLFSVTPLLSVSFVPEPIMKHFLFKQTLNESYSLKSKDFHKILHLSTSTGLSVLMRPPFTDQLANKDLYPWWPGHHSSFQVLQNPESHPRRAIFPKSPDQIAQAHT